MIPGRKDVWIYIDEAGKLSQDDASDYFVLSCCVTDNPTKIKEKLCSLREDILKNPYYADFLEDFERQGFHASKNHPDILAEYYKLLFRLNLRIYSVVINKDTDVFSNLVAQYNRPLELYPFFARTLLRDRILSERQNNIHIIFEEYGSSITKHKTDMTDVVRAIVKECVNNGVKQDILFDVDIHTKEDLLLSTVDFANYVLFQMLKDVDPKKNTRMISNFNLIEPKIAHLHSFHNRKHYHSPKKINFDEIKGRLGVK